MQQMNVLSQLFAFGIVFVIMSFAIGMIAGGSALGKKIVSWELKKLTQIGRWILRHLFQAIAEIFQYLAKSCGTKKAKKP